MQSIFVLAELPMRELLPKIRRGLPTAMFDQVADALGLSAAVLAEKLGIARRTLTRKQVSGEPLSPETSEKVLRIAKIRNLAQTLFTTDEAISKWLSRPDAALANMAPIDLFDTEFGTREVENLVLALAHGMVV